MGGRALPVQGTGQVGGGEGDRGCARVGGGGGVASAAVSGPGEVRGWA